MDFAEAKCSNKSSPVYLHNHLLVGSCIHGLTLFKLMLKANSHCKVLKRQKVNLTIMYVGRRGCSADSE